MEQALLDQLETEKLIDELQAEAKNLRLQLQFAREQNRIARVRQARLEAILGMEEM